MVALTAAFMLMLHEIGLAGTIWTKGFEAGVMSHHQAASSPQCSRAARCPTGRHQRRGRVAGRPRPAFSVKFANDRIKCMSMCVIIIAPYVAKDNARSNCGSIRRSIDGITQPHLAKIWCASHVRQSDSRRVQGSRSAGSSIGLDIQGNAVAASLGGGATHPLPGATGATSTATSIEAG